MHNLYAIFATFLEICKCFSKNLVNEHGNNPRRGVVSRFSDLEVVALNLTAEALSIDSENYLFHKLAEYRSSFPNLISRRQYNDRKKNTASLCESIRKNMAMETDGGEDMFCIDSKPIEVCRIELNAVRWARTTRHRPTMVSVLHKTHTIMDITSCNLRFKWSNPLVRPHKSGCSRHQLSQRCEVGISRLQHFR